VPKPDTREIAAIFFGGAAGSLLRVLVAHELPGIDPAQPFAEIGTRRSVGHNAAENE
jgi:fluoride ion exporter CrcB/FEX